MILIFITVTFFTALVLFAYIKLKYPFWNNQPVFHVYDYWRYFYKTPFIVYPYRPVKTKFYDTEYIRTIPYLEASSDQRNQFTDLLQCHYYSTDRVFNTVLKEDIHAYFSGANQPPFVSFYYTQHYPPDSFGAHDNYMGVSTLMPVKKNGKELSYPKGGRVRDHAVVSTWEPRSGSKGFEGSETALRSQPGSHFVALRGSEGVGVPPIGCISSRSTNLYFRPTLTEEVYTKMPVYIIDYLCVSRDLENRKRDISRKLLQTHEYNQRIKNPSISVSLIKAEVDLFDGVVPLFQYTTATYNLRNIFFPPLPTNFQVVEIYKENLDILTDFLHTQSNLDFSREPCDFDVFIMPDMGVLLSLIRRRLLYVYCLQRSGNTYGMYFIKNAKIRYEDVDGNTLQLIGSVLDYRQYDRGELHYLGFLHLLKLIIKKKPSFKMLLFDEIGHNKILTRYWRNKHTPLFKNEVALYMYNMIFPRSPVPPERVFTLF